MIDQIQPVVAGGVQLALIVNIVLSGIVLIVVNLLTHMGINYVQTRSQQVAQVRQKLNPLLHATADLVSRISEILITNNKSMLEAIASYEPETLPKRIKYLSVLNINRHESTAYRLVNFLALSAHFTRKTADLPAFPLLDRIDYFIHHKIAVALRGNLYGLRLLNTELQEEIAARYLDRDRSLEAVDLTLGQFVDALKEGDYDASLFKASLDLFSLDCVVVKMTSPIDRNSDKWKHALVLAHLAVYLIDFYQELAVDPQWEEHRIFFVRLIRQWNTDAPKHLYLYEQDDLEGDNYFDTFPAHRTSDQSVLFSLSQMIPKMFGFRMWIARQCKTIRLQYRGSRFGKRHHPKSIESWGVSINVGARVYEIRWTQDLKSVYDDVRAYLKVRLLDMGK